MWDADAQVLWWVDIWSRQIHRFDPVTGQQRTWTTPQEPGSLAPRSNGNGLVVAMGNAFHFFDPAQATFTRAARAFDAAIPARFNDGRTDRQGRFWAGSVHAREDEPAQSVAGLYRLDSTTSASLTVDGLRCSNGLAWSPDGATMYHADSHARRVWRWEFDRASGNIANRTVFIDMTDVGIPDGASVDSEGCYWVALWLSGQIARYDPNGVLMARVELPTRAPTCCEFGGTNLDVLYVSTATLQRASEPANAADPMAGSLLAIDVGVKGVRSVPCRT